MEHVTTSPSIDYFIAVILINFNSTALFKNAFLGLYLAGKPFGGDFEQLSPRKMKKHIIRIARFASGLSSGGCRPYPRFHQGPQWSILPIQELIFIAVIFDQFQ